MSMTPAEMREMAAAVLETEAGRLIGDIVPGDDAGAKLHHHAAGVLLTTAQDVRAIPIPDTTDAAKYAVGDSVEKIRGSKWRGTVVGFYETDNTPVGYVVESWFEPGSVQAWPKAALGPWTPPTAMAADDALERDAIKAKLAEAEDAKTENAKLNQTLFNLERSFDESRKATNFWYGKANAADDVLEKAREALVPFSWVFRFVDDRITGDPDMKSFGIEVMGLHVSDFRRALEALAAIDAAKAKGGG